MSLSDAAVLSLAVNLPAVAFPPSLSSANHFASDLVVSGEARATPPSSSVVLSTDGGVPTSPAEEPGTLVAAENGEILSSTSDAGNATVLPPPGLAAPQGHSLPLSPASPARTSEPGESGVEVDTDQDVDGGSLPPSSGSLPDQPRSPPRMRTLGVQTQLTVLKRGMSVLAVY